MAKEKLFFDGESIIACTEIAAKYFGVSSQTLSNWANAGCPRYEYGYWDVRRVSDWREKKTALKAAEAEASQEEMTLAEQKVFFDGKLKEAQLETAQLKNAILRGDYLERQFVVAELSRFTSMMKTSFTGLGGKLAREIAHYVEPDVARKADKRIKEVIRDGLEQIAVEGVYRAKGR